MSSHLSLSYQSRTAAGADMMLCENSLASVLRVAVFVSHDYLPAVIETVYPYRESPDIVEGFQSVPLLTT